jgi:hypothetical protein
LVSEVMRRVLAPFILALEEMLVAVSFSIRYLSCPVAFPVAAGRPKTHEYINEIYLSCLEKRADCL